MIIFSWFLSFHDIKYFFLFFSSLFFTPSPSEGLRMVGGANDGSIHVWQERKVYSKPDLLIRLAHPQGAVVTCVIVSPNGFVNLYHFSTRQSFPPINLYHFSTRQSISFLHPSIHITFPPVNPYYFYLSTRQRYTICCKFFSHTKMFLHTRVSCKFFAVFREFDLHFIIFDLC